MIHRLAVVLVFAAAANAAAPTSVCYEDLGCFSTDPPFSAFGRVALLPNSPDDMKTEFQLYTKKNMDKYQLLVAKNDKLLEQSNYNGKVPTKFIMHGWIDSTGMGPWMKEMAKHFLMNEDCNVILVNWVGGGRKLYGQAVANTRVVGAQIAQLSFWLSEKTGADHSKFHLLGHSLGSHVAGYAGERMPELGRITGMDPADPYFQNMSRAVRLDETDAKFVDIIHTDANDIFTILNPFNNMNGLGLWQPSGHVDVYPNGGLNQPGCGAKGPIKLIIKDGIVEGMRYTIACAHMRAYDYAMESITSSCPFRSYACKDFDEFKTGRCLRCPATGDKTKGCNGLGTVAVKPSDNSVNNVFWAVTGDKAPFCRYHYHIQLTIKNDKNKKQKGIVWVRLFGDRGATDKLQLGEGNFYINPGAVYDFLVTSPTNIGKPTSVEVSWKHDAAFYEISQWQWSPTIVPQSVAVFGGESQLESTFCDNGSALKSKASRNVSKQC